MQSLFRPATSLRPTGLKVASLFHRRHHPLQLLVLRGVASSSSGSSQAKGGNGADAQPQCYVVDLEGNDAGISVLSLNRPRARNALSRRFLAEFNQSLERIKANSDTRVVVVKSEVDNVFCAGADLKERATMSPSEVLQFLDVLRKSFRRLETASVPTIAAIDGAALGGGLEMALCCDLRVAGSKAKIGLPETKLAIIPGAGGTQRLPRIVGKALAKELIFTGRVLDASQAARLGIVNAAVETSAFEKALELAREIVPQGPIALQMAKIAIDGGLDRSLEDGLNFENQCYDQVIPTEDRLEGLRAFAEKRKPEYKGR